MGTYQYDSRYTKVGSTNEYELFEKNGVHQEIINKHIPIFPFEASKLYEYFFYTANYIKWKPEC
jgi:hypothetical protein